MEGRAESAEEEGKMRREKEMKRNEKRLTKAICCGLAALFLFWAFPAQVKAVPLSSNPSGTSLPAGGDSNGGEEGGGEEAQQAGGEVQQPDGGAARYGDRKQR